MRSLKLLELSVISLIFLAACSAIGIATPKTFNERSAYAHTVVNGVVTAATNSINAGAIKSTDAEYVRDAAIRTRALLAAAEAAFGSGDLSTAEGRLDLAEGVLRELQTYLGSRGTKP